MDLGELEKPIKVGMFECEVLYESIIIRIMNLFGVTEEEITFNVKEMKDLETLVKKIKERMRLKYGLKFFTKIFGVE